MIHPTAIIAEGARLAADVEIGPYAIIGPHVTIGRGTHVGPHAVIEGWTTIGDHNRIFHHTSVGAIPQDLKYRGEETYLKIGDRNTIREFATLHLGTVTGDGETTVQHDNLFMAYSHVAHDCHLGSGIVMANSATLAGHVSIEDYVILGGLCAVHQFVRIGCHAMIGGGTLVSNDIPPYVIATGEGRDTKLRGLNLIGLKRRQFSDETLSILKKAYKILVMSKLKLSDALARMHAELPKTAEVDHLLSFIEASQRGICR